MQALGNEVEILIELNCGNHLRTLIITVSIHQIRIRVGIAAGIVITEHDVLYSYMLVIHRIICREENGIGMHQ